MCCLNCLRIGLNTFIEAEVHEVNLWLIYKNMNITVYGRDDAVSFPCFFVEPIIGSSVQPWALPKKQLHFAMLFLFGKSSYEMGSFIFDNKFPKLLFSSFDKTIYPRMANVPVGYYCEFSESFIWDDGGFDLVSAYNSLAHTNPVVFPGEERVSWLIDYFEKMHSTQHSHYLFKYDQIRNYISLIIHEGLKDMRAVIPLR